MPYHIAGIDVHKKMLAVAVADVAVEGDVQFERLKVGPSPVQLRALADWLVEREVDEVVMESTAQYWRPVWETLERYWRPTRRTHPDASPASGTLHLAQAQSNRAAGGRKRDFPDAERLVKRLIAQELTLSFVPDAEQRLWRTVMRRKYQITRNRVQLHNRLESLLEEAHTKISSVVSDLLGTSTRRMLHAVGDGETDPTALAALADSRLRATPDQLRDAFGACADLHPVYRRLVKLTLDKTAKTAPRSALSTRTCRCVPGQVVSLCPRRLSRSAWVCDPWLRSLENPLHRSSHPSQSRMFRVFEGWPKPLNEKRRRGVQLKLGQSARSHRRAAALRIPPRGDPESLGWGTPCTSDTRRVGIHAGELS